jgi:hypothetical protein
VTCPRFSQSIPVISRQRMLLWLWTISSRKRFITSRVQDHIFRSSFSSSPLRPNLRPITAKAPHKAPQTSPFTPKPPANAAMALTTSKSCFPNFSCPTARVAWAHWNSFGFLNSCIAFIRISSGDMPPPFPNAIVLKGPKMPTADTALGRARIFRNFLRFTCHLPISLQSPKDIYLPPFLDEMLKHRPSWSRIPLVAVPFLNSLQIPSYLPIYWCQARVDTKCLEPEPGRRNSPASVAAPITDKARGFSWGLLSFPL